MLVEKTRPVIPAPIRSEMAQRAKARAEIARTSRDFSPEGSELWKFYNHIMEAELEAVDFWNLE